MRAEQLIEILKKYPTALVRILEGSYRAKNENWNTVRDWSYHKETNELWIYTWA